MHDAFLVHVAEGAADLPHEVPYGAFLELKIFCLFFLDESLEVALLGPLSHNDQLVVVDERVDVLDDVWVAQLLHYIHLPQALLSLLLVRHVKNLNHT